jgi:NTP pyrophosphatase (non-canonical NTP hydrolase)
MDIIMEIIKEIKYELIRAKTLHPVFPKTPVAAMSIIAEECGEAIREANRIEDDRTGNIEDLKKEIIQTIATCIRALETL